MDEEYLSRAYRMHVENRNNRNLIDHLMQEIGFGRNYGAISDVLSGYDHRGAGVPFVRDTTTVGMTFITRPLLNLSYDNIAGNALLSILNASDPRSPFAYIRAVLDPKGRHPCAHFDNRQAFIPLLTNTCIDHTGWPDIVGEIYTSPTGKRLEEWGMVDAPAEYNKGFELTTSFSNMEGNMMSYLFSVWMAYAGLAYMGEVFPSASAMYNNYLDYPSRQWRITLDRYKNIVVDIGTAIGTWPMTNPIGQRFNYTRDQPYLSNDTIDIQWRCHGLEYNVPYLIDEFNANVAYYLGFSAGSLKEVPLADLNYFNFQNLFPFIDPNTRILKWMYDGASGL